MNIKSESYVKKKIKKAVLEAYPGAWSFMPVQMGYGQQGIPDHIFCLPIQITEDMVGKYVGIFAGIEAKTEKGKLSKLQGIQLAKINVAKGYADVVRGSDDINRMISLVTRLYPPYV